MPSHIIVFKWESFSRPISPSTPVYHKRVIVWKWRFSGWDTDAWKLIRYCPLWKLFSVLTLSFFPALSVSISYYFCYSVSLVVCRLFFSSLHTPSCRIYLSDSLCFLSSLPAFYFLSSKSLCVSNGQINNYIPPLVSLDIEEDTDKTNRVS